MLVFFIYAYVGVVLFREAPDAEWINEHANFRTFAVASLTLLRVATMESWVGLMEECALFKGQLIATPYFCTFLVSVSTILLQVRCRRLRFALSCDGASCVRALTHGDHRAAQYMVLPCLVAQAAALSAPHPLSLSHGGTEHFVAPRSTATDCRDQKRRKAVYNNLR